MPGLFARRRAVRRDAGTLMLVLTGRAAGLEGDAQDRGVLRVCMCPDKTYLRLQSAGEGSHRTGGCVVEPGVEGRSSRTGRTLRRSRRVVFNVALDRNQLIDDIGKDVAATSP